MKTKIKINTRLSDFIHCWPEAPEEVKFLRTPHRHELHVGVTMEVVHDDRDVEFFMLKREVDKMLAWGKDQWVERISMEQIAKDLIEALKAKYGDKFYEVSVFEDGEVGAIVSTR